MRPASLREMSIYRNMAAMRRIGADVIASLTRAATLSTFYHDGLSSEQVAANQRIVTISEATCLAAARSEHQLFAAAFSERDLAGYVIATRHGADDLELDWLMVDPRHHGSGAAARLMQMGLDWLGSAHPIWLSVIRHNRRAIRFYQRFGFEIDLDTPTAHTVPHWIMRRPPAAVTPLAPAPAADGRETV